MFRSRRKGRPWLWALPLVLPLPLGACDGDGGPGGAMDSGVRYLVQGSDMGAVFQNVEVLRNGTDPVTDATVAVNGTALEHIDDGLYRVQLPSAVPAGDPIVLEVRIGQDLVRGTDVMPEAPTVSGPADGSTFETTDVIPVTWTSSTDPERFSVSATWVEGNTGRGLRFDASGGSRSFTISAADLPTGLSVEIRVFAFNDGTFSGPFMQGSKMSIRGARGGNPSITITP